MWSKSIILTHILKEVADKTSRKGNLPGSSISTSTSSAVRAEDPKDLYSNSISRTSTHRGGFVGRSPASVRPLIGFRSRLRVDYSATPNDPRSLLFAQHTLRLRNNPNSAHYETGRVPRRSPQEAGEGGHGGVHGDAHVCQRQAEHQEIAGGPQLPHFEEGDHCHRI